MDQFSPMFLETLFGFVCLFAITKILGKTSINQITPFDFVSALILGELVGNALFDKNAGILDIGFVIILWGGLLLIVEIITQKFKGSRGFLEGKPAIVIQNGQLVREVMKKNRLDVNQLQHLLREKNVFTMKEVQFAILETNGTVSVLKKSDYQTPTRQDINLAPQEVKLATTLINDGEIIYDNLQELDLTEEWLLEEMVKQGYTHVKDVFYAEYTKGNKLFLLPF
ncbi:DUF421 domain-containing protein [Ornithinibacillus salinisoli]|uniref:DUF421 domain-containing protein n=1 Tax=Ornithinibacillus salinisoli TaxID=1848459 RepID=A0ABW4W2X1_9BACI